MASRSRWVALAGAGLLISPVVVAVGGPPAAAAVSYVVVDKAAALGLSAVEKSWSAAVVDYDGDGDEDVWIGYHQWSGKLFANTGGHYAAIPSNAWPRVRPSSGKVTDRHDCAFADVNLDGRPDAYCSAGRNQSNLVKHGMENELWLQRATPGMFDDVGVDWGLGDECGRGRHVTFLNVNGDAYPDLFLGDAIPRNVSDACDGSPSLPDENSKVFINEQGNGFTQLAYSGITTLGVGQRCAERLDYDRDGWDDLVGCRFDNQTPRLYHNEHGSFRDVSSDNGLTRNLADVVVADLDGDGWDDLITAATGGFGYRLNRAGSFGPEVTIGSGSRGEGRSVAVGDVDGDGDLDVYGLMANGSHVDNPDDVLFLNDHLSFTRLAVPSAAGDGDEVVAIHPGSDRKADFLVLNGGEPVGPVQVITVEATGPSNSPPTAVIAAPQCVDLTCTFDSAGSRDPDGSIAATAWSFSDGASGWDPVLDHTFAQAGTYTAVLTVTDDLGSTGTASVTVRVGASPPPDETVAFRAGASSSASGRGVTVTVPSAARAGDVALLYVSASLKGTVLTPPSGWQPLQTITDDWMSTRVWWQQMSDDGGAPLSVSSSSTAILAASILVYSGVSTVVAPVSTGAAEPSWRTAHSAPAIDAGAGDWVVWSWSDKTGQNPTTAWSLPAGATERTRAIPTAAPGRVTVLLADSGAVGVAGLIPATTAVASSPSRTATMSTVVLRPAG